MRLHTRLAASTAAILLALGTTAILASPAGALPTVSVTGSAPATVHGPGTVIFSYSIDVLSNIGSTTLTTHQPAELPALVAGVTLDGLPVPAGQVSQPDSVDITVQTGADPTDGLAAGTHIITFVATVGAGASATTSATATLAWVAGASPQSALSNAVPVAINQPDIEVTLTPDSGEDQVGALGTGVELSLAVDVKNLGYGTPQTTLDVVLPPGTVLAADGVYRDSDGDPLSCTPDSSDPQHVSCLIGSLGHYVTTMDPTIYINITTAATPPVGQVATLAVSAGVNPGEGTDTDPTNNEVNPQFSFTGSAALSYSITSNKTKVQLAGQASITLTVHNSGPQPANDTIAIGILVGDNFSITDFSGDVGSPIAGMSASVPAAHALLASVATPGQGNTLVPADNSVLTNLLNSSDGRVWFVGNLAVGQSASVVLTVKAIKLGTAKVGLFAVSTAGDPSCLNLDCDLTSISLQAVAVPIVKPPAAAGTVEQAAADPAAELANTGAASRPILVAGLGLLVGGAILTCAGRRRRSAEQGR
ncbi:hypothetical protein ACSMXN_02995 [Jatrophihabitans sp. DSM 45814]